MIPMKALMASMVKMILTGMPPESRGTARPGAAAPKV
jgi:hypothetical protein